eukprot:scpid87989/ scgid32082/ 
MFAALQPLPLQSGPVGCRISKSQGSTPIKLRPITNEMDAPAKLIHRKTMTSITLRIFIFVSSFTQLSGIFGSSPFIIQLEPAIKITHTDQVKVVGLMLGKLGFNEAPGAFSKCVHSYSHGYGDSLTTTSERPFTLHDETTTAVLSSSYRLHVQCVGVREESF